MDKLTLHAMTRKSLEAYIRRPAHALLLHGESGVGLGTIARRLAISLGKSELIELEPDEKGTITIEIIHRLYQQTRSRRPDVRLVVVIDDAEAMSPPAQNALLKLLEEPVENVHFILTSHHKERILQTIRSRAAALFVRPVDLSTSQAFVQSLDASLSQENLQQLMFIANGRPAELTRLVRNDGLFEAKARLVQDAKSMLSAPAYEKIKLITKYEKNRTDAIELLGTMFSLLKFMALRKTSLDAALSASKVEATMQALQQNGHVRTHLMSLATS